MSGVDDRVAAAYIEACLAELDAPKPGNVHRFAPGHRMEVDGLRSKRRGERGSDRVKGGAGRNPRPRRRRGDPQGSRPEHQSRHHPPVRAACGGGRGRGCGFAPWRLAQVLDGLDRADAENVFAAIAAANPGGLGRAPRHDVNAPATVTLREAMAEAAGRDRIARQYVTAYDDVFLLGLPALETARQRHGEARWSTLAVYLALSRGDPRHAYRTKI